MVRDCRFDVSAGTKKKKILLIKQKSADLFDFMLDT